MKNFKYFILFLSLITIFEITNSKDANAVDACDTDSNGEIEYTNIPSAACIAVGAATNYEITVKEIYLCTTAPLAPTTSTPTDLSSCENILLNSSATATSFAAGEDVNIPGTFKRPPNGTYPYVFVKLVNTWGITAAVEFDLSMDGMKRGSGVHCRTIEASGNHDSNTSHEESVCNGTYVAPGKFTETTRQFGDVGGSEPFRPCAIDGTVKIPANCVNTGNGNIFLVQSNDKLATASNNATGIHGILKPATVVKVTPSTSAIITRFDVTNGTALAAVDSGAGVYIGLGPFDIIISVE